MKLEHEFLFELFVKPFLRNMKKKKKKNLCKGLIFISFCYTGYYLFIYLILKFI